MSEEKEYMDHSEIGLQDIIIDLFSSLSAVKELSELNCLASSEKDLLKNALLVLIENQDMEQCSFFVLNEEDYLVNVTGLRHAGEDDTQDVNYQPIKFEIGEGVIGIAAQSGVLQHCQDCANDKRFLGDVKQNPQLLPGSIISVPVLAANNELIGVLNISHPEAYHFTDWHIHLLEIYKNMLGQLITNYRLFQSMESQIKVRTATLEKSLVDLNNLKEHYQSISMIDQLTGLYNRRFFYEQVEIAIANTKRYGQSICLLILDLDHFKQANDEYGHGFGDRVLINVSTEIQRQVRETDILVRFGGEEFIVIFTNTTCKNGEVFAERIRESIASLKWKDKKSFSQTVSIGLYCLNDECKKFDEDINIDKIISFADAALYEAKEKGRNQVVVHATENK